MVLGGILRKCKMMRSSSVWLGIFTFFQGILSILFHVLQKTFQTLHFLDPQTQHTGPLDLQTQHGWRIGICLELGKKILEWSNTHLS